MNPLKAIKSLYKDPSGSFEIIKNALYTKYSKDPALMMVHTGTVGWILSAAAQLWNVATSDKFTSDEKKFLIPQEALDAAVNITLFYGLTNVCKTISSKLVSTGKLLSKELRTHITNNPLKGDFKLGDLKTDLSAIYKNDPKFLEKYLPFKSGVDMAVNTVACIIASNIITPYVRNFFSAIQQKRSIAKDKANLTPIDRPVLPMQNRFGINDYVAKTVYPSNSSLKV